MHGFRKSVKNSILFLILIIAGAAAFGQSIEVRSMGKAISGGGTWFIPMNSGSSKVALFSEQREPFSIYNTGSADVKIKAVT